MMEFVSFMLEFQKVRVLFRGAVTSQGAKWISRFAVLSAYSLTFTKLHPGGLVKWQRTDARGNRKRAETFVAADTVWR